MTSDGDPRSQLSPEPSATTPSVDDAIDEASARATEAAHPITNLVSALEHLLASTRSLGPSYARFVQMCKLGDEAKVADAQRQLHESRRTFPEALQRARAAIPGVDPLIRAIFSTKPGEWTSQLNQLISELHSVIETSGDRIPTEGGAADEYLRICRDIAEKLHRLRNVDISAINQDTRQGELDLAKAAEFDRVALERVRRKAQNAADRTELRIHVIGEGGGSPSPEHTRDRMSETWAEMRGKHPLPRSAGVAWFLGYQDESTAKSVYGLLCDIGEAFGVIEQIPGDPRNSRALKVAIEAMAELASSASSPLGERNRWYGQENGDFVCGVDEHVDLEPILWIPDEIKQRWKSDRSTDWWAWGDAFTLIERSCDELLGDATSEFIGAGSVIAPPRPAPDASETSGPVAKPDGWTRSELVAQAKDRAGSFGASTFDKIRIASGVTASDSGGKGQQRRYSRAELRKLIDAVENGSFRNRIKIAKAWRELLDQ